MGRSIAKHGSKTAAISYFKVKFQRKSTAPSHKRPVFPKAVFILLAIIIQCYPANPAQAGEEAVGLADLSGLPSSFCVLVGE